MPGIYGDFDGPSMLPLIAPRPLLVINGDQDDLTPLPGVQESARAAEQAYRLANAREKFQLLVQRDAGHEFTAGRTADQPGLAREMAEAVDRRSLPRSHVAAEKSFENDLRASVSPWPVEFRYFLRP